MTVKKIIYKIFIGLPRKIYFLILNYYREKLIVKYPNLFRFSSEPYITGDTFRNIADHVLDDGKSIDLKKVSNGDIIFVQSNYIDNYFENYNLKIKKKHILISHNHYSPVTEKHLENLSENLIFWLAENLTTSINHDKLKALPLGIENLKKFKNGIRSHFESEQVKINQEKKDKLVLSSFAPHTNLESRKEIAEIVQKINYIDIATYPDHKNYILNLSKYKFNICPSGIGVDTHRYWESLYVKTIPIVVRNNLINHYEKYKIPMLILNDWEELFDFNKEELNQIYIKENMKFKNDRYMWIDYWIELINNNI
ncbi:hypothetical protein N9U41_00545 [Acidimicrobiaceae bacterium]|nr:hypothetical protein [Acidimicrobiaceae bacterium]